MAASGWIVASRPQMIIGPSQEIKIGSGAGGEQLFNLCPEPIFPVEALEFIYYFPKLC
jgi:hypothetical protein